MSNSELAEKVLKIARIKGVSRLSIGDISEFLSLSNIHAVSVYQYMVDMGSINDSGIIISYSSEPEPPVSLDDPESALHRHVSTLGYEVVDRVTGFKGVITSVSFDLYGCIQAVVSPKSSTGDSMPDGKWFDLARLETTSDEPVMELPNFDKGYIAEGKKGPAEKPAF